MDSTLIHPLDTPPLNFQGTTVQFLKLSNWKAGRSLVRSKFRWPIHSQTHFWPGSKATNWKLPYVVENAFVLVQDYLHFGPQSLAAPRTQTQNKELYLEHKNTIRLSTKDIYISRRKDTKDGSHNHTTWNNNTKSDCERYRQFAHNQHLTSPLPVTTRLYWGQNNPYLESIAW